MHWFERTYVFNETGEFRDNIVFWKRQMDDIFFCMERQQGGIGAVCVEVKRNRDQNSIYLGS